MKKQYIIVILSLGFCLAVFQIVQAQRSSGRSAIFKELGLKDVPLPPAATNDLKEVPSNASEKVETSASPTQAEMEVVTENPIDSSLPKLDDLADDADAISAFQEAVDDLLNSEPPSETAQLSETSDESTSQGTRDTDEISKFLGAFEGETESPDSEESLPDDQELLSLIDTLSEATASNAASDPKESLNESAQDHSAINKEAVIAGGIDADVSESPSPEKLIESQVTQDESEKSPVSEKIVTMAPKAKGNSFLNSLKQLIGDKVATDVAAREIQEMPFREYHIIEKPSAALSKEDLSLQSEVPHPVHITSDSPAEIPAPSADWNEAQDELNLEEIKNQFEQKIADLDAEPIVDDKESEVTEVVEESLEPVTIPAPEITQQVIQTNRAETDVAESAAAVSAPGQIENSGGGIAQLEPVDVQASNLKNNNPQQAEVEAPEFFNADADVNEMVDLDNPHVVQNPQPINSLVGNENIENLSPEVVAFLEQYQSEQSGQDSFESDSSSVPLVKPAQFSSEVESTEPLTQNTSSQLGQRGNALVASSEIVPFIAIDEAELTGAIRQLARQAGINFIFDPGVIAGQNANGDLVVFPPVTVRFENVTALQALEAVLDSYDLALEPNKKTRIAKVTYRRPPTEAPLESQVIQLKFHSADEMSEILSSFVSTRSSLKPHNKSSKIVVSATKEELEKIAELVYELDIPSKNVLIEANILETSKNPKSIRGLDWSGTFSNHKLSFGNGLSGGSQTSNTGNDLVTQFSGAGMSVVTGGFNPDIAFLNSDGLNAVLNFLNTDNQTRVVATPRTVTQNAVEATLEVTRAFPIFMESPGSQAVPATTSIIYTNLGTILRVTPRISADDSVTLKVNPEVSNVDGKDQSQVGGRTSEANIYAIRRMESTVRVPSGHTLVMGGLTSDTRSKKQNKVPLLGDIPLLGNLFQNKEKSQENQNLIVFITPTIVKEDDYQPTQSEFLRSKLEIGESDIEFDSLWDSAEPYEW